MRPNTYTNTHTYIHIYIYMYLYVFIRICNVYIYIHTCSIRQTLCRASLYNCNLRLKYCVQQKFPRKCAFSGIVKEVRWPNVTSLAKPEAVTIKDPGPGVHVRIAFRRGTPGIPRVYLVHGGALKSNISPQAANSWDAKFCGMKQRQDATSNHIHRHALSFA